MKLVKSLLLGSAAGLAAVAGAQAADLPVRKAAPIEYVRVCTAYGAGFFYIPGTDTCIKLGGRARMEYNYTETFARNGNGGSISGYRALGRLSMDARTQTAYGTLRTFVRIDIASRTGSLISGSSFRTAIAFRGEGTDHFNTNQRYVELDTAIVQFAGFTAGRVQSFFDFYAQSGELIGSSLGTSKAPTNVFAYTAALGNGFSATLSVEDPTERRTPIFNVGTVGAAAGTFANFANYTQALALAPVVAPGGLALVDVTQKNRMPDIVGVLRYDAPWGAAQLSAVVHEIAVGTYQQGVLANAVPGVTQTFARRPNNAYGWAVQGGLKINAPFVAPGDTLWLQGAYSQGAQHYGGATNLFGYDVNAGINQGVGIGSKFATQQVDAVVNPFTRRLDLTTAWTFVGSFLHYWSPEWRSSFYGSYGEVYQPRNARANAALIGILPALGSNAFLFNQNLRDYSGLVAGATLIWSPVRDLDIGVDGVYQRIEILRGRVADLNRPAGAVAGIPVRTAKTDDNFVFRFRVQRDF